MKNMITLSSGLIMIASFLFVIIYLIFLILLPFLSNNSIVIMAFICSIFITKKYVKVVLT